MLPVTLQRVIKMEKTIQVKVETAKTTLRVTLHIKVVVVVIWETKIHPVPHQKVIKMEKIIQVKEKTVKTTMTVTLHTKAVMVLAAAQMALAQMKTVMK